jgi:CRP/FNR family cyclic AMP-dependent transcriptional regulator
VNGAGGLWVALGGRFASGAGYDASAMIPVAVTELRRYSMFAGVADAALDFVLERMGRIHFEAGAVILEQGAHGEGVYFIREGRVRIEVDGIEIAELHEGELFGEMHLIDIQTRSAAVYACAPVDALTLSNADLMALRKRDIEAFIMILMNCSRDISRRLRESNRRYAALLRGSRSLES